MKKTVAYFLSATLAVTALAGCSGGDKSKETDTKTGGASASPSAGASASPAAPKEPTTIQFGNLYPNLDMNNPVMTELQKRTNTKFDPITVTGDRNQKFDLWLASGDFPADMLVLKPDYVEKYKDAGAILQLDELIEKHGKNIKEKYGKYFDLLRGNDGHIYSLFVPKLATEPSPLLQANFGVRYDVLEESGYPEIKTFDQLFDVLQAFYKKHPEIDGKQIIPFTGFNYNGNGGENLATPSSEGSGMLNEGGFKVNADNSLLHQYRTEEMKKYYQFLNKMYNAGMLDKEFFTLKPEAAVKKITENRVLAGFFPSWWVQPEVEKIMRASGDTNHLFAYFPITFDSSAPNNSFTSTLTRSNWNWVISKKTKNPEEVIKLLDYIFSDEGQILINWGIEGKHFEVKDGKRTVNAEFDKNKASNPDLIWKEIASPFYGTSLYLDHGTKLADGDYATPTTKESVKKGYDARTNEVLKAYGKEVWSDFLPQIKLKQGTLGELSGDMKADAAKITERAKQLWLKESPKIIFSKNEEEFNKQWDAFQVQLDKEGMKKVEEAYTALWKENVEKNAKYFK